VTRRATAIAIGVAVLGLAACGGGSGSSTSTVSPAEAETAIEETWAAFVQAVTRGDGEAACAELSDELARPGEVNFAIGAQVPGDPSCEDTFADTEALASFAAGLPKDFAELTVEGTTADGIAGAAKPTFEEVDGQWVITSFYGVLPEE
jgi:hypothetical protein